MIRDLDPIVLQALRTCLRTVRSYEDDSAWITRTDAQRAARRKWAADALVAVIRYDLSRRTRSAQRSEVSDPRLAADWAYIAGAPEDWTQTQWDNLRAQQQVFAKVLGARLTLTDAIEAKQLTINRVRDFMLSPEVSVDSTR